MSQVVIGDILPYTQAVATSSQTVFGTNWTADVASDVIVYQTPAGSPPNDVTQMLPYPAGYSVAFIGSQQQVQVTLTTGANAGDIITITRQTPADRMNLYTNTNFVPSMLNNDFGILTLVDQQAQLVNQLIGPRYNYSALIVDVVDTILPILGPNQVWVKSADNTQIEAFEISTESSGTVNPGLANQIAYYVEDGDEVSGLSTVTSGVLVTDSSAVPSISKILPQAVQLNITSVGVISSGVWQGSPIVVGAGGTGDSSFTAYSLICGGMTSTGALQNVSGVGSTNQVLVSQGAGALPQWASVPGLTIAALTSANDTNVTLTLGGSPSNALLQAASITAGWSGQLSLTRGGTNANLTASNGGILYSTASAVAILSGTATANQMLQSGSSTTPLWSTATWPSTTTINQILWSSAANTVAGLSTANSSVMITSSGGVPSFSTALPSGLTATNFTMTTPILGIPQSGTLTNCTGFPTSGLAGLGTGVATALAINIGTAGSVIVNGGALGTPSSGTLTNASGLPIAGITGLGTGVATALAAAVSGSGGIALLNNPTFDNITVLATTSGSPISVSIGNNSNTSGSDARTVIQTAGSSSGNPYIGFGVTSGNFYSLGTLNTTGQPFVGYLNGTLTGSKFLNMNSSGQINYPLQPAFSAVLETGQTNVTGNNTAYNLGTGATLTVIFDQASNVTTSGVFTAPITGKYSLNAGAQISNCTISQSLAVNIVTTNRTYSSMYYRAASNLNMGSNISVLADMNAADTAFVQIIVTGESANTNTLVGTTNPRSYFNGHLTV